MPLSWRWITPGPCWAGDRSTVGIYHEQGMLDGRWIDVIVLEKILD
jgi:hypothetical protein